MKRVDCTAKVLNKTTVCAENHERFLENNMFHLTKRVSVFCSLFSTWINVDLGKFVVCQLFYQIPDLKHFVWSFYRWSTNYRVVMGMRHWWGGIWNWPAFKVRVIKSIRINKMWLPICSFTKKLHGGCLSNFCFTKNFMCKVLLYNIQIMSNRLYSYESILWGQKGPFRKAHCSVPSQSYALKVSINSISR